METIFIFLYRGHSIVLFVILHGITNCIYCYFINNYEREIHYMRKPLAEVDDRSHMMLDMLHSLVGKDYIITASTSIS